MSTDFDDHKDTYKETLHGSIAFSGQDVDFFTETKANLIREIAHKQLADPKTLKVLDIGCGIGMTDRLIASDFYALHGVDIAPSTLKDAARANPTAHYKTYDGKTLPYEDGCFDVVFAICVLHHVMPEERNAFIKEMRRVTRPGGIDLIFEHNPLNPLTLWVVNHCPFDEDAVLLRMAETLELFRQNALDIVERKYFLFFPWKSSLLKTMERGLSYLPLGAQYLVAGKV